LVNDESIKTGTFMLAISISIFIVGVILYDFDIWELLGKCIMVIGMIGMLISAIVIVWGDDIKKFVRTEV